MHNRLDAYEFEYRKKIVELPVERECDIASRYRHIVVPVNVSLADEPQILTGFEYAAIHGARLTILQILPSIHPEKSMHWLDAIDRLCESSNDETYRLISLAYREFIERAQLELTEYLDEYFSPEIRARVDIQLEHRTGDIAEATAKFAIENDVDLVIVAGKRPTWWYPFLPSVTRRIMQLVHVPCLLILPSKKLRSNATRNGRKALLPDY